MQGLLTLPETSDDTTNQHTADALDLLRRLEANDGLSALFITELPNEVFDRAYALLEEGTSDDAALEAARQALLDEDERIIPRILSTLDPLPDPSVAEVFL